ncbi:DNA-directed RNA polymerase I subunit rpa49 [Exophiala oligosperma]
MAVKEKKRKASAQDGERPAKKAQTNTVKVKHVSGADDAQPVVAHSPGVFLPSDLNFDAYSKTGSGRSTLLLHSSSHPTIDHLAAESKTTSVADKHTKHYIAVFDPSSNKLSVIPAKKMTVRSSVRQAAPDESADTSDAEAQLSQPASSSRAALTEAFGTKKSRKAVASMAENRLLARAEDDDPLSTAILSSIKEEDAPVLSAAAADRSNKPLPPADLTTDEIKDVYPLSVLVHPGPAHTTLSQMRIQPWIDRISASKEINSRFRYVAHRVKPLTALHIDQQNEHTLLPLQLLRYITILLELYVYVSRLPPLRTIPQPEKWPESTISDTHLGSAFLSKLLHAFFPNSLPTAHARTLLTTTILALTLHIPPPKWTPGADVNVLLTEPSDIGLDLALQPAEVGKYYRELGCRMETLTDNELTKYGWEKVGKGKKATDEDGAGGVKKPRFAKLRFPVEFPKISAGRPSRR